MARGRTLSLKVEAEVKGAEKLVDLGRRISGVGDKMTVGFTLPLVAAGTAAFKFASDLQESTSKAATVFGQESDRIKRAAESMDDAFSESTFLDTAGTFGALLQSMGLTEKAAADLSLTWLDLAQDMASFHNTNPEEALQAIRSALAGEFEPLKRYGVMLNVATIEQRALEAGLWDGVGAIDAQTRALVINEELMRQQPKVLGDYARTADGAANAGRRLLANFTDTAAALGQELLPLGTELLKTVDGWVRGFKEMDPALRTWIVQAGLVLAAIGPILAIVGRLTTAWGLLAAAAQRGWLAMAGPVGIAAVVEEQTSSILESLINSFGGMTLRQMWQESTAGPSEQDIEQFAGQIQAWGDRGVRTIEEAKAQAAAAAGEIPGEMVESMADAFRTEQEKLRDPIRQLVEFMDTHLSPAREKAYLQGFLASRELANGLGSNDPIIRAKSLEMKLAAESRLAELDGYKYGRNLALTLAHGMRAELGTVSLASYAIANRVRGPIMIESEPPDPNSPLRGITKWGGNIVKTIAEGIREQAATIPNALYGALEVPRLPGPRPGASGALATSGAVAGQVININLAVMGNLKAETPEDVVSVLQRLQPFIGGNVVR